MLWLSLSTSSTQLLACSRLLSENPLFIWWNNTKIFHTKESVTKSLFPVGKQCSIFDVLYTNVWHFGCKKPLYLPALLLSFCCSTHSVNSKPAFTQRSHQNPQSSQRWSQSQSRSLTTHNQLLSERGGFLWRVGSACGLTSHGYQACVISAEWEAIMDTLCKSLWIKASAIYLKHKHLLLGPWV